MDFLNGNIKSMYLKYLGAAFGSSLISSIYGVVDMAVVGQYHGPEGTAAPATLVLADSYKDTFVNNLNYDPAAFNDPASINNNFTGMGSIGFPSAVMIAATWNTDLATRFGESIGKMADGMGVSGWYAPAMNVHRSVFAADVLLAALVLFLEWKTMKGYKKRKQ